MLMTHNYNVYLLLIIIHNFCLGEGNNNRKAGRLIGDTAAVTKTAAVRDAFVFVSGSSPADPAWGFQINIFVSPFST